MSVKLCECGCGKPAPIAKRTRQRLGHVKGQPMRFIYGHHRSMKGKNNPRWNGGTTKSGKDKRICIYMPNHPRAKISNYILEYVLIAEKALGKFLPKGTVVHHANDDPTDNRNQNLVVCQDVKYHKLLHRRKKALNACGHANWLKCPFCKEYDDPFNMYCSQHKHYHRKCYNKQRSKR